MKRILTSLSTLAFGFVMRSGTLVPPMFCEGIRHQDGAYYGPWIDEHAIPTFTVDMNDPVARAAARLTHSKAWKREVRAGQTAKCGKASF